MKIIEVEIPCDSCRKPYITHAIDGHITYPHICDSCYLEIVKSMQAEYDLGFTMDNVIIDPDGTIHYGRITSVSAIPKGTSVYRRSKE